MRFPLFRAGLGMVAILAIVSCLVPSFPREAAADTVLLNTLTVTAQDVASSSSTGANSQAFVTGTPTAGSAAVYAIQGQDQAVFQVSGTWTGTLTVEESADAGVTWIAHAVHQIGTPLITNGFTGNFVASLNSSGKTHLRVRATAAWTGTANVRVTLGTGDVTVYVGNGLSIQDGSSSTSTVRATIKAASAPSIPADTSMVVAQVPYTYAHISTDATTLVKSGAGILHNICVNTVGAASTITVDDALTATTPTMAVISGATLGCYRYDVAFLTGLTIVTAVAAPDLTVSYR